MKDYYFGRYAGFCGGVARSVSLLEACLRESGCVYCIGNPIHNAIEVSRLKELGLCVVDSESDIPDCAQVFLRSHGTAKNVIDALLLRGAIVTDGTCPKVKSIHQIASAASDAGKQVVIMGDPKHPEVCGICGWAKDPIVVSDPEELRKLLDDVPKLRTDSFALVFQSTANLEYLALSEKIIKKLCTNADLFDTICGATHERQEEAIALSARCDLMIVVGDPESANSRHLADICRRSGKPVLQIQDAQAPFLSEVARYDTVGIIAGASVPSRILKEVRNKMDELKEIQAVETEKSFEELLEDSIKAIYNGDRVKGTVVGITNTEVTVDLGTKQSGYIPVEDFTDAAEGKIEDLIHIGDEVEACVVRVNDGDGTISLSKKRLDAVRNWTDLEEAVENESVVEGVVTEENKGGLVVNVKGIRVFVPASQSGLPRDAELNQLLKQTVRLKIREVNKARKRVVGSIRDVTAKERKERIAEIWENIEVGKHYEGTVKSLTGYGAFVDIGGVDGMVHVSELSWGRITKPSDVVSVGDVLDVYVINFDKETRKISLGYKDPAMNPWNLFTEQFEVGSVASVKVVKLMTFGAFAEVIPGVDGLIHISQIANRRIANPGEVLTVGDVVEAKITGIDQENHKVSLSIRALSEPEPAPAPVADDESDAEPVEAEALVYEVSETGEAAGIAPEENTEE